MIVDRQHLIVAGPTIGYDPTKVNPKERWYIPGGGAVGQFLLVSAPGQSLEVVANLEYKVDPDSSDITFQSLKNVQQLVLDIQLDAGTAAKYVIHEVGFSTQSTNIQRFVPKQSGDSLGAGFTFWEGEDEGAFWAVFPNTAVSEFYFCFAIREKGNPDAEGIVFDPKIRNQGSGGGDFPSPFPAPTKPPRKTKVGILP